jgi:alpha-N-arabinofuranosidase
MITAALKINHDDPPRVYNRKIFGHFIEHFHRQVYGGIFDPGNPLSDEQGFRKDVIEALRELDVPIIRWPGGCFVSAYHWRNGVGKTRTPSWDKAWHVEDPNTFGTDEFVTWCRKVGAKPYICTNAGTGTQEEMSDWVEYCNLKTEGFFAKLRGTNGHPDPHRVKYWSIGNENWGGHEMGAKTIEEWGPFV